MVNALKRVVRAKRVIKRWLDGYVARQLFDYNEEVILTKKATMIQKYLRGRIAC
jgi:hypothetical protein